jgi:hypothetical protein
MLTITSEAEEERMTEEMSEQIIRELMEVVGLTDEEARLRLRDEDLWLLPPEQRFDEYLQGKEGVRAWEDAAQVAKTLARSVSNGPSTIQANPAVTQLVWDAAERAQRALHRARKRAGNPEMRSTVFGRVLAELLEKRQIPITPFRVGKLAEDAGLDGWKVIGRMADADAEAVRGFGDLARKLDLSEPEKTELAFAHLFERRNSA